MIKCPDLIREAALSGTLAMVLLRQLFQITSLESFSPSLLNSFQLSLENYQQRTIIFTLSADKLVGKKTLGPVCLMVT